MHHRRTHSAKTFALIIALLATGNLLGTPSLADGNQTPRKIVVAHRGASAYAPENTLPAFRAAAQMGADYVEYDIQVTKDRQLICLHDETLERTTDVEDVFPERFRKPTPGGVKHWYVYDFTLQEIKQLDAGAWVADKFKGTRVPTFQETIDELRGKAGHFIELKKPGMYNAMGIDVERMVLAELKKNKLDRRGADPQTPVLIQSFDAPSIRKLAAQLKTDLPLHLLIADKDKETWLTREGLAKVKEFCTGISPEKGALASDPRITEWARAQKLLITPYTFRTNQTTDVGQMRAEMSRQLFELNVDGLITDNPDQVPRRPPL